MDLSSYLVDVARGGEISSRLNFQLVTSESRLRSLLLIFTGTITIHTYDKFLSSGELFK
jgi:hypothetical protein